MRQPIVKLYILYVLVHGYFNPQFLVIQVLFVADWDWQLSMVIWSSNVRAVKFSFSSVALDLHKRQFLYFMSLG